MIDKKDMIVDLDRKTIIIGSYIFSIYLIKAAYERIKQAEGIAKAKQAGKATGRPLTIPDNFFMYYDMVNRNEISVIAAARSMDIARSKFYRIKNLYEQGIITRE